jgi:glycolate oxidase iron-sulfur subunit
VQYGRLVDIGRAIVDRKVPRGAGARAVRWALKEGLNSAAFAPAMKLGQAVRGLLPPLLRAKVPAPRDPGRWPDAAHARKVLLLAGCVQPAMMPNINSATARVLDAAGIQTLVADEAGCCGAIRLHLDVLEGARAQMRRNIDAWWPLVEGRTGHGPVEAIVMNASGCGVTVKEYGHSLAHDPAYADKARRIAELTKDLSELLPTLVPALKPQLTRRVDEAQPRKRLGSTRPRRPSASSSAPTWPEPATAGRRAVWRCAGWCSAARRWSTPAWVRGSPATATAARGWSTCTGSPRRRCT